MGKKFIYSISSHIIPVSRAEQINLPKKTRTLLLQIQLAEESKNWCKLEALFDELGNLYTDAEDWEKLVGIARREVRLADRLGGKDAARVQTRALYRLSKSYRELEQYDAAIDHNLMYVKAAKLLGDPNNFSPISNLLSPILRGTKLVMAMYWVALIVKRT
ncbi:hypothetical protein BC832DRAFT_259853 [Gaertneriomyces semiglobifer]|nr:hypothetical protein BC832DRAFT_259853 [Gaertneriomyces semiglobifer]